MNSTTIKYIKIGAIAILSVLLVWAIFGIVTNITYATGEEQVWDVKNPSAIKHLEIEVNAADLKIEVGERFHITSNLKYLEVYESSDGLVIEESFHVEKNYNHAFLTITIPEILTFSDVKITFGAGRFSVDTLHAETIEFDHGAGEVDIRDLYVSKGININDGAGKMTIDGGSINNLHLDMGAGEVDIRAEILGHSELHFGIGDAKITLLGTSEIYTVEISEHIGDVLINDMDFTHESIIGDGPNHLDINGGVGLVELIFEQ